jgi:hypothetical protein
MEPIFIRTFVVSILSATIVLSRQASAQVAGCTYDRCALRLQSRPFADRVVQGTNATVVGNLGMFAPRLEPLATAGDSAGSHYESFRSYQNRGATLSLIGGAAGIAGVIWLISTAEDFEDPPGAMWALLGVGLAFSIAGNITVRVGRDHLHQAIWFYNRTLVSP